MSDLSRTLEIRVGRHYTRTMLDRARLVFVEREVPDEVCRFVRGRTTYWMREYSRNVFECMSAKYDKKTDEGVDE